MTESHLQLSESLGLMTKQKLAKRLHSVGFECYAKHFDLFSSTDCTKKGASEELSRREPAFASAGCVIRVSFARQILKASCQKDALTMIASSSKMSDKVRRLALRYLLELQENPTGGNS